MGMQTQLPGRELSRPRSSSASPLAQPTLALAQAHMVLPMGPQGLKGSSGPPAPTLRQLRSAPSS